MIDKINMKKEKKGFFSRLLEKLDKKLEEKSKESKCCGGSGKSKSCCS